VETIDRRTLIRRAAGVTAAAWTAPLIIESLVSPAAALSTGVTFTSLGSFTDTTSGASTISAAGFSSSTAGHAVLVFVSTVQATSAPSIGVDAGGPIAAPNLVAGPLTYVTGATRSWTVAAYWAVGTGAGGGFTVDVAPGTSRDTILTLVQVDGENTSSPIGAAPTANGNPGSSNGVTFPAPRSGNGQVLFGSDRTGDTWTPPAGFVELADTAVSAILSVEASATGSAQSGLVAATPSSGSVRWAAVGVEINHV